MTTTKVTLAYRALLQCVATTLKDHKRLNDPYNLDENDGAQLRQGWGVRVDEGEPTRRCINPEYFLRRTFTVALTRECPAKDSDPERREAAAFELFEDLHLLIAKTVENITLGDTSFDFAFAGDGGIQEVFAEKKPYVALEARFTVEYHQRVGG